MPIEIRKLEFPTALKELGLIKNKDNDEQA